jgi:hypothetical protein
MEYPALYHAADRASNGAQARVFWWLGINLALFVVVSVLSATNSMEKGLWILCGVLLATNFALTLALALLKPEQTWFASRAIAESVKTASWRFASRAEPFQHEDEGAAVNAFLGRLREIFRSNMRFSAKFTHALDGEQLPAGLLARRRLSLQQRRGEYRDSRVIEQKQWYSKNAGKNRRGAQLTFGITLFAMGAATALHLYRASDLNWGYWPGDTAVTIALSLLAWLQARRYQELSETYSIAAQDIALVEAGWHAATSEKEFSQYVADAENAFSREHTQWIARKDK